MNNSRPLGPRARALQNTPSNPSVGPMTKASLLKMIRDFKHLPATVGLDSKKAVLVNLLLAYINDNEILSAVWQAGITDLGKTLEEQVKGLQT